MEILKLATLLMCIGFARSVEISVKIQLGGNVTSSMEEIITARDEEELRAEMTKKLEKILAENPTDDVTITTEFRHGIEVHTTHVTAFDVSTSHQEITTAKLNTALGNNDVTTDVASSTKNQLPTTKTNDVITDVVSSTKNQPPTTKTDDVTTPYVTDNVFSTRSVTSAITNPYKEPTTAVADGMLYNGKRYVALASVRVNKATAFKECQNIGGNLANIYNRAHMDILMEYIRQNKMDRSSVKGFHLGMIYDPINKILRLRNGTQVSISDYKWYPDHPLNGTRWTSCTNMVFGIDRDSSSAYQYLLNWSDSYRYSLCEV